MDLIAVADPLDVVSSFVHKVQWCNCSTGYVTCPHVLMYEETGHHRRQTVYACRAVNQTLRFYS